MLSGNLNGKTHIKVNSSGNSDAEKTKADFATWYKKRKNPPMKKRTKNRIADVREKRARFASGLARTARSARLRFCLFRRFVFIQGVCLSRRAQRADLFKTSIRLSAKGVKYRDKLRRIWGVCIIIKLYRWLTICAKCVYYIVATNWILRMKALLPW